MKNKLKMELNFGKFKVSSVIKWHNLYKHAYYILYVSYTINKNTIPPNTV